MKNDLPSIKIKPYLLRLIKENIAYIIANILFFVLILLVVYISIGKANDIDSQNSVLNQDITQLQNRYNLLNTVVPPTAELDSDIAMLNQLIPNNEDYFSIIYTLDNLSKETGFIINSYTINLDQSTANKLDLTITGSGDTSSFVKFLEDYNYQGGRFITSDQIKLDPQVSQDISINLTFYNQNVNLDYSQVPDINGQTMAQVEALKSKINFSLKQASSESAVNYNYKTKSNPF